MAHTKHRVSIPLDDATVDALRRLADATNSSIGATAGSFLDGMAPNFIQLAEVYELAKSNPTAAASLVQQIGSQAQGKFDSAQKMLIDEANGGGSV